MLIFTLTVISPDNNEPNVSVHLNKDDLFKALRGLVGADEHYPDVQAEDLLAALADDAYEIHVDEHTPAVTVSVLTIEHKHGSNISVFSTYERAKQAVYDFAAEYWDEIDSGPIPTDKDEAIEIYFEGQGDEFWTLVETTIDA